MKVYSHTTLTNTKATVTGECITLRIFVKNGPFLFVFNYVFAGTAQLKYSWTIGWEVGGSIPRRDEECFLLHSIQTGSGPHPASYPVGAESSFPWVKSGLGLQYAIYTSTPPHVFMAWCLIN
jgi:hypothetical protein